MKIINFFKYFLITLIFFARNTTPLIAMQEESSNIIISANLSDKFYQARNQLMEGLSNNRPEMIIEAMDKFLDLIPLQYQQNVSEAFYHSLLYIFFLSTGYEVHAERPSGDGSSDMIVIPKNKGRYYIFEFKISNPKHTRSNEYPTNEEFTKNIMIKGMEQIFANDYYGMFHQHGKPFSFLSVLFARPWISKGKKVTKDTYKTFSGGATKDANNFGSFSNVASLALGVAQSPVTFRLINIIEPGEKNITVPSDEGNQNSSEIRLKHTEYRRYIQLGNFEQMLVKRQNSNANLDNISSDFEENINLKNISKALQDADFSKLLKNV